MVLISMLLKTKVYEGIVSKRRINKNYINLGGFIMKKLLIALLTLVMVSTNLSVGFAAGDVTIKIDTKVLQTEPKAYISSEGRTMIPVRVVSEALQCIVDWDGINRVVTIRQGDKNIVLKIGDFNATIDGKAYTMDTKAVINQDRTFVPFRFVSEALGYQVEWDASLRTVTIFKYDPSKWVRVDENGEYAELSLNIPWSEYNRFMANCDYAEKIIAKKYNYDIAKKVIDIARKKTSENTRFVQQLENNGKKIDIEATGSVTILFWKAGVL